MHLLICCPPLAGSLQSLGAVQMHFSWLKVHPSLSAVNMFQVHKCCETTSKCYHWEVRLFSAYK